MRIGLRALALSAAVAGLLAGPSATAAAQDAHGHHGSAQTPGKGEGEVRRVDRDTGKITIRHGPLEGMDMPAMTMVFQADDRALLDRVQVGDRVRFTVVRGGGAMRLQTLDKLP